jgi:RNA polymerase sigma-70 factor (ECF subfamily)
MPWSSTIEERTLTPDSEARDLKSLLEAALAGNQPALEGLLLELRPYLHALVRARIGSADGAGLDKSALVQEGLLRIYQNIQRLREGTVPHLLAWVRQIVRNLMVDAMRAKRNERGKVALAEILEPGECDEELEKREEQAERAVRVAEALSHLSERRRQVIELSFFEELSDAEIGTRLGGSAGAVRVLRFRALQDLRRWLEHGKSSLSNLSSPGRGEKNLGNSTSDSDCRTPCSAQAEGDNR